MARPGPRISHVIIVVGAISHPDQQARLPPLELAPPVVPPPLPLHSLDTTHVELLGLFSRDRPARRTQGSCSGRSVDSTVEMAPGAVHSEVTERSLTVAIAELHTAD